jgi:hypothetical protein
MVREICDLINKYLNVSIKNATEYNYGLMQHTRGHTFLKSQEITNENASQIALICALIQHFLCDK